MRTPKAKRLSCQRGHVNWRITQIKLAGLDVGDDCGTLDGSRFPPEASSSGHWAWAEEKLKPSGENAAGGLGVRPSVVPYVPFFCALDICRLASLYRTPRFLIHTSAPFRRGFSLLPFPNGWATMTCDLRITWPRSGGAFFCDLTLRTASDTLLVGSGARVK